MSLRRSCALRNIVFGALVALALSAQDVGRARAEPELALSWQAEPPCPDAAWAERALAARLGRAPKNVAHGLEAQVVLRANGARFALTLHTEQRGGAGDRILDGARCDELADAAILLLALALEAEAPAPPTPRAQAGDRERPPSLSPRQERTRPTPRDRLTVRAALAATRGDQPAWGMGGELAVATDFGPLAIEIGALWLAPRESDAIGDGARVRVALWTLRPLLCRSLRFGGLRAGGCLGAELGRVDGSGLGLADRQRNHAFWRAVALAPRLAVALSGPLGWVFVLGVAVPLVRPRYVTSAADGGAGRPLYTTAPIAGRATLGLEARF